MRGTLDTYATPSASQRWRTDNRPDLAAKRLPTTDEPRSTIRRTPAAKHPQNTDEPSDPARLPRGPARLKPNIRHQQPAEARWNGHRGMAAARKRQTPWALRSPWRTATGRAGIGLLPWWC